MNSTKLRALIDKGVSKGLPKHDDLEGVLTDYEFEAIYCFKWMMYLMVQKVYRVSGPTSFNVTLPSGTVGFGSTLLEALVDTRK